MFDRFQREGRRHWTIYAVFFLVLLTAGSMIRFHLVNRSLSRFEDAINEAGGAVHYDGSFSRSFEFRGARFFLSDRKPVAVEISSGSHPIPSRLDTLRTMKSVRRLSLNTSAVGDHLVPTLGTFRYLAVLDLSETEISARAVIQLLEALPGLREFRLSGESFSENDLEQLRSHPLAAKLSFAGADR